MNLQFVTSYDLIVDVSGGPAIEQVDAELNNGALYALALADQVVAKDLIRLVRAVVEGEPTHLIHAKDGKAYQAVIPDYDPIAIANKINQPNLAYVLIGNITIQKHQVSRVAAIEKPSN